jgi:hypothetical protein
MSTPLECGERVVEGGTAARWEDVSDKEGSRREGHFELLWPFHFPQPTPPMALLLRTVAALALLVVIQAACPNQCR